MIFFPPSYATVETTQCFSLTCNQKFHLKCKQEYNALLKRLGLFTKIKIVYCAGAADTMPCKNTAMNNTEQFIINQINPLFSSML